MTRAKNSNHVKAPKSAAFVKQMRAVFGDEVKTLYVEENEFKLGEPSDKDSVLASTYQVSVA